MISTIVSRLVILVFGTLYPAYASYKAVRTKNVKEYVKWMMYWIVFALFTCAETFTDVFLSWFPFYYEIKIILVLWLLSPATKGSSILYRKFVHPMLSRREQEIDDYIAKAKEQGYHTVLNLGTKGVNYATTVIMQTAIKGGGGLVNQLRKSYSLSDLSDNPETRAETRGLPEHINEGSDVIDARHHRRRHSPRRSASGSSRVDMYFPEVDIRQGPSLPHGTHVRSTEDVSSGYSSAEPLYVGQPPKLEAREGLVRTASVGGSSTRSRTRTARLGVSAAKKTTTTVPEDSEESESETESSDITVIRAMPELINILKVSRKSNSSDESDNNFEDTIGFPAEIPIKKIDNIIDKTSIEAINDNKSDTIDISTSTTIVQNDDNVEVATVCNVEIQIEKQPSIDIFEDTTSFETENEENNVDKKEEIQNEVFLETKTDVLENEQNKPKLDDIEVNKENKIESTKNLEIEDNGDYETLSMSSVSTRGGKYNKSTAPLPPSQTEKPKTIEDKTDNVSSDNTPNITKSVTPEKEVIAVPINNDKLELDEPKSLSEASPQSSIRESHPIKATLVLKPGIIKSVGPPSEDSSKTQIFVSQSPKAKRKSKNDSPISRLMMLPKKIFGHKDGGHSSNEDLKRKSWHDDSRSLTPSSIEDVKLSKSDTEGSYEQLLFKSDDKKSKKSDSSKILVRNLSHSPKQYRRKTKEERRYNYEDSD